MNPKVIVQSLRGSRAQIVLAFLFARCAMDTAEIMSWTGQNYETANRSLANLEAMGLVGKQVLAHNKHLWIPGSDLLPGFTVPELEGQTPQLPGQFAEISGTGPTTTTVLIKSKRLKNLLTKTVVEEASSRKNRELETDDQKAIWRICKRAGIGEPTRTTIALETDYPPEYILAHVFCARDDGLSTRLLIHRIRERDWLPETVKEEARAKLAEYSQEEF